MPSRRRFGWTALLLSAVLVVGVSACTRSDADSGSSASPFRNLGKRADADVGALRPEPAR